jgi:hypothetical protein
MCDEFEGRNHAHGNSASNSLSFQRGRQCFANRVNNEFRFVELDVMAAASGDNQFTMRKTM